MKIFKQLLLKFLGSAIIDCSTGEVLGVALMICWRGKLYLFGYQGPPLRVEFLAEEPFSYRRRVVGFRKAIVPDEVNCVKKVVDHA